MIKSIKANQELLIMVAIVLVTIAGGVFLNHITNSFIPGLMLNGYLIMYTMIQTRDKKLKRYEANFDSERMRREKAEYEASELRRIVNQKTKSQGHNRSYTIVKHGSESGIVCHRCELTSWNKSDAENKYCANCEEFHE